MDNKYCKCKQKLFLFWYSRSHLLHNLQVDVNITYEITCLYKAIPHKLLFQKMKQEGNDSEALTHVLIYILIKMDILHITFQRLHLCNYDLRTNNFMLPFVTE